MRALSFDELLGKAFQGDVDAENMARDHAHDALLETWKTGRLSQEWAIRIATLLIFNPLPVKRRRGRQTNRDRNYFITAAIKAVIKLGFDPTRNREGSSTESACSIVAKALEQIGTSLTEAAVEKIWKR
jgi:hypothetical protein